MNYIYKGKSMSRNSKRSNISSFITLRCHAATGDVADVVVVSSDTATTGVVSGGVGRRQQIAVQ